MRGVPVVLALAMLATISGCAHPRGAEPPAAGPAPAAAAKTPSPGQQLTAAMTDALAQGDLARAAALVVAARDAPAEARPGGELLAYWDAVVHTSGGDWAGAAGVMTGFLDGVPRSDGAAFRFHDALIALRTAQGDLAGAIAEIDETARAAEHGTWGTAAERATDGRLKERWHRAYLLRMLAQTRGGAERDGLIRDAERARTEYAAAAASDQDLADSVAVLDAYFAFCDGDRAAMLTAARRVNVDHDDDNEDLYLVQLALAGGGDAAGAEHVRQRMRANASPNVIAPIFFAWMRTDDAADAGAAARFSPKHPGTPAGATTP